MKKNRAMVTVVSGFASLVFLAGAAEPVKVGIVDAQKIITSLESGKKAQSEFESFVNKKKAELQKEQTALQKQVQEYQKQAAVLKDNVRQEREGKLQEQANKLQMSFMKFEKEDAPKKQAELFQPIMEKLRRMIKSVAPKKGYTMVLEKNASTVLYSQDQDDLTEEMIKAYPSFKE